MKVLIFGASGMVGQGILRECLQAPDVEAVVCVTRGPLPQAHRKLRVVETRDVTDLSALKGELSRFDACFFPLGVSSAGMKEDEYRAKTYDLTLAIARQLAGVNPKMTFTYVSGRGTDSTEQGKSMWARVKGKTENDLLALFPNAYMFRPGVIRAMDGIKSKTPLYNRMYVVMKPFVELAHRLRPGSMNTTRGIGQAMLNVARHGYPKRVLEVEDINAAAAMNAPSSHATGT